jgi:Zn-dependent protease
LAAILVLGFFLSPYRDGIVLTYLGPFILDLPNPRVADLVNSTLFVCVIWGVMNLLPIFPLDGGQIAREIFVTLRPHDGIQQSLMLSIVVAILTAAAGYLFMQSIFIALLFGYLAFTSYATLQAYRGRNPW